MFGSRILAPAFVTMVTATLAVLGGASATAAATPGLAPQFAKWSVPIYASHVTHELTWAPQSYEIDTSDSMDRVIAWYASKLKGRSMHIDLHTPRRSELAVDGGNYAINIIRAGTGAMISVIKN